MSVPHNVDMHSKCHAYTKLPDSRHAQAKPAGVPAAVGAGALLYSKADPTAASIKMPAPAYVELSQPSSNPITSAAFEPELATARVSPPESEATASPGQRFQILADKVAPPVAAPVITHTDVSIRTAGGSILGRTNGGFVPWGSDRGNIRPLARTNANVPAGRMGGMAKGSGMGEAVTNCEAKELVAMRAGLSPHNRSSGAGYGVTGTGASADCDKCAK